VKKVREGYKMTELGEIPGEWEIKPLNKIAYKIGDGLHGTPVYSEDGDYYFINGNNLNDGKILITNETKKVNEIEYHKYKKELNNNTLLISLNGTIGNLACYNSEKVVLGKSCGYITLKESVYKNYIFYALNSNKIQLHFYKELTGTTIKNLSLDTLRKTNIPIPYIKEQQKISSILSSVDEQIEISDNLIEKMKELKEGLMQRLLTKGIGHSRFKNTEIGRIPEEWEVFRIKDVSDTTSGGTPSRTHKEYYKNGTILWVKTGELGKKYIFDSEEKITEEAVLKSSAKLIPINSVLIAMYGATIGKTSISKKELTTNQACCAIICKEGVLNYEFLYYILNFNKNSLIKLGAGGAQPNINQIIIKEYKIPVPSLQEQQKISSILSSVDDQISQYESKKEKLQELKKGLMQKLLTGKIRVKVS
jgi:type I restriction enzyme S subunit